MEEEESGEGAREGMGRASRAQARVPMPTAARRIAKRRRISVQRKVGSSAYIACRDGRAMI